MLQNKEVTRCMFQYLEIPEMLGVKCLNRASSLSVVVPNLVKPNLSKPLFKDLIAGPVDDERFVNREQWALWYSNEIFGGNIHTPIKQAVTGLGGHIERATYIVSKTNKLADVIEAFSLKAMYYQFNGVRMDGNRFVDISILTEETLTGAESYFDMVKGLTGVVRLVEYTVNEDNSQSLSAVIEG